MRLCACDEGAGGARGFWACGEGAGGADGRCACGEGAGIASGLGAPMINPQTLQDLAPMLTEVPHCMQEGIRGSFPTDSDSDVCNFTPECISNHCPFDVAGAFRSGLPARAPPMARFGIPALRDIGSSGERPVPAVLIPPRQTAPGTPGTPADVPRPARRRLQPSDPGRRVRGRRR